MTGGNTDHYTTRDVIMYCFDISSPFEGGKSQGRKGIEMKNKPEGTKNTELPPNSPQDHTVS